MKLIFLIVSIFTSLLAFGTLCRVPSPILNIRSIHSTKNKLLKKEKVAFVGDSGIGENPSKVFEMIKKWDADAMIQLGDFDYTDDPNQFFDLLDNVFPKDFPIFAIVGNHDIIKWDDYSKGFLDRLEKSNVLKDCTGEFGISMHCNWKGLNIVVSGVGTMGKDHEEYLETTLQSTFDPNSNSPKWNLCAWHKNQRLFQTGDKTDETGYAVYDICRRHGSMIITAHQHQYSRYH